MYYSFAKLCEILHEWTIDKKHVLVNITSFNFTFELVLLLFTINKLTSNNTGFQLNYITFNKSSTRHSTNCQLTSHGYSLYGGQITLMSWARVTCLGLALAADSGTKVSDNRTIPIRQLTELWPGGPESKLWIYIS